MAAVTLTAGSMRELLLGSTSILLVRTSEGLCAVEATCPHLGGVLSDGRLEGRRLSCPQHAAAFEVTTGAVLADPSGVEPPVGGTDPLRTYSVRVEGGIVEVDLPP